MAIKRKKPGKTSAGEANQRPVRRDYVEEIRRQAETLTKDDLRNRPQISGDDIARRQQAQIEAHMARLRSETVHARHLAQHIDNLSQEVAAQKRKRIMTDTTTVDPGQAQRSKRRSSDKPRAVTKTSSFNPLHPSMELPPEELIRLLGVESKKLRKQRKSSKPATPEKAPKAPRQPAEPQQALDSSPAETPMQQPEEPAPKSVKRGSKARRNRMEAAAFDDGRRNLLLPAMAVGLVCGIGLSAYLFWGQPTPEQAKTQTATATAPAKPARTTAVAKPEKPAGKAAPGSQPAASKKVVPAYAEDPAWQAAIRKEEQRLRTEAEHRFNERLADTSSTLPAVLPETPAVNLPISESTSGSISRQTTAPVSTNDTTYELVDEPLDTELPLSSSSATDVSGAYADSEEFITPDAIVDEAGDTPITEPAGPEDSTDSL